MHCKIIGNKYGTMDLLHCQCRPRTMMAPDCGKQSVWQIPWCNVHHRRSIGIMAAAS